MRKPLLLTCGLVIALASTACEKDEFADAPSVEAPSGGAAPKAEEPKPSSNLPANHPPMGEVQKSAGRTKKRMGGAGKVGFASPAEFGATGPLRWNAPKGWTASKPASSMRLAEYVVPGNDGSQPATMSIFYFGPRGGGGVEANVKRWVGQFSKPAGGRPEVDRKTRTVNGMKVHTVDVTGTYNPGMSGGPPKKDQRMLAAIVESRAGLFFFKLVGPSDTMDDQEDEFEAFVNSFESGA